MKTNDELSERQDDVEFGMSLIGVILILMAIILFTEPAQCSDVGCISKFIIPASWVKEWKSKESPVYVLYSTENCGHCVAIKRMLDEKKIAYSFGSGDKEAGIQFYPTIVILNGNKEEKRLVGSVEILTWARLKYEKVPNKD